MPASFISFLNFPLAYFSELHKAKRSVTRHGSLILVVQTVSDGRLCSFGLLAALRCEKLQQFPDGGAIRCATRAKGRRASSTPAASPTR